MSQPLSDFGAAFRAHVIPRLRPLVMCHADLLALDMETFTEAQSAILRMAIKHGALHLPPGELALIENWIGSAILTREAATRGRLDACV